MAAEAFGLDGAWLIEEVELAGTHLGLAGEKGGLC